MPLGNVLMVQGTASSVGKSLLVTALCRLYARRGWSVAPFKAQNMALNAAVTPDGGEIGRAQAVQALAAGVETRVEMNPILLKPEGHSRSQLVVLGRVEGTLSAVEYQARKPRLRRLVDRSLNTLREAHDLVVIEGAGSPAEINLRRGDLVNMYVARQAMAPVLLAGDIDRGGVFAAFVGTMALLRPAERKLIAGFVVNKFRGDRSLLQPGLDFLEKKTGKPVLGVLPFLEQLGLPEEDSLGLDIRTGKPRPPEGLDVVAVRYPWVSNYDDLAPLEGEPGVTVRFVKTPAEAQQADLVVLPGSKNTLADLAWLKEQGWGEFLRARTGRPVVGICGGFQMLGERVENPHAMEGGLPSADGLGLLPVVTQLEQEKRTARVKAWPIGPSFLTGSEPWPEQPPLTGYEIHLGRVERQNGAQPLFRLEGAPLGDGAASPDGNLAGTLIHGLWDNQSFRVDLLERLWRRRGLTPPPGTGRGNDLLNGFDRLADAVETHLDLERLEALVFGGGRP
ncbi:MAG: cobyric acid synthase [Deltaproteobacteria bacterium]|nr:cobyric acid synthase [Deltaproteobacteria bacterium]